MVCRIISASPFISSICGTQLALSEKVMTITNKQAEMDELEAKFKALKAATDKKHAALNAELSARQTEVQNITQIKEVCPHQLCRQYIISRQCQIPPRFFHRKEDFF